MANTPNNDIPYVPENTTDPAAGLNLALDVIDTTLQLAVLAIQNTPPAVDSSGPLDGDRYIIGSAPTGDWSGHAGEIARWVDDPGYWTFANAHYALNLDDDLLYKFVGGTWAQAGGSTGGSVDKVQPELTSTATVPAPDNSSRELIQPTDSSGAAFTITPDASGWQEGDYLEVVDSTGTSWSANAVTVDFGTHNYHSSSGQTEVLTSGGTRRFRYVNSTIGFTDGG